MSFKEKTGKKVVLVGTYRAGQLECWPGYYNYPLIADVAVDAEAAKGTIPSNASRGGRHDIA